MFIIFVLPAINIKFQLNSNYISIHIMDALKLRNSKSDLWCRTSIRLRSSIMSRYPLYTSLYWLRVLGLLVGALRWIFTCSPHQHTVNSLKTAAIYVYFTCLPRIYIYIYTCTTHIPDIDMLSAVLLPSLLQIEGLNWYLTSRGT